MRSVSGLGRAAAVGAVVVAVVLVAVLLFSGAGGGGYTIKADFVNASQLVKGNIVQIGGTQAGSVKKLQLTPHGLAEITMKLKGMYKPIPQGTRAVIRQASLSGYANHYIELQMPPGDKSKMPSIPDGGTITTDHTTSAVDLDEVFNTLDPKTRKALQGVLKGSAAQYQGAVKQANLGYHYLNPALSTSSRLFNELDRDTPVLNHFLTDSARLVNALASRRDSLAALISNLNTMMHAIGSQRAALADAIGRLPGFMRQANTTFVNLRSTLDTVDPLVNASKPVARKLRPFLDQLRPFTRDARPTVHDVNLMIAKRGRDNDLINLLQTSGPLAHIAVDTAQRNGKQREGAFPESAKALKASAPIIAQGRPYTPDLLGWFDDFSTTGGYDALGGISRAHNQFNAFSVSGSGLVPLFTLTDPNARANAFKDTARTHQFRRCPGAAESPAPDGSNVWSAADQQTLDCRDSDRATGPIKK